MSSLIKGTSKYYCPKKWVAPQQVKEKKKKQGRGKGVSFKSRKRRSKNEILKKGTKIRHENKGVDKNFKNYPLNIQKSFQKKNT